jgi:predicted transcriptional regulator
MVLDFAPQHWSSGTRLVAIALADRVNQDWQAWPSLNDIARRTGLSTRQVRTHLRTLEQEGVIVQTVQRRANGSRQTNLWTWLWKIQLQAEADFRTKRKWASASP